MCDSKCGCYVVGEGDVEEEIKRNNVKWGERDGGMPKAETHTTFLCVAFPR